jgi:hypothetical protein
MTDFYKYWGMNTDKKAPEPTRFAEILCLLPLATGETKADKRSAAIAAVEAAKPPRKAPSARKAKPEPIIEAPATEPEAPVAGGFTADALAALAELIAATALDPAADRRAKKTLAQRLRRAAAKAAVQWRGDDALTAAAAE